MSLKNARLLLFQVNCQDNMGYRRPLLFLTLLLCLGHVYCYMSQAQMKQAMKTVRNMCLPKSGVSKDALAKMNEGQFDDEDRKLKCYLACVLGMMQAVKNNKINLSMIKNQVTKMVEPDMGKRILASFEGCAGVTGTDNCDLAYNFAKCTYERDPEVFLVP